MKPTPKKLETYMVPLHDLHEKRKDRVSLYAYPRQYQQHENPEKDCATQTNERRRLRETLIFGGQEVNNISIIKQASKCSRCCIGIVSPCPTGRPAAS